MPMEAHGMEADHVDRKAERKFLLAEMSAQHDIMMGISTQKSSQMQRCSLFLAWPDRCSKNLLFTNF